MKKNEEIKPKLYDIKANKYVIGNKIKERLNKIGMKRSELIEKVDTSPQTMNAIEKGSNTNIELMANIALVLGTTVDYLLGLDDKKDTSALTDTQKFNIIKDFINLVNPEFELQPYTVEETEIDYSSGYPDTYEVTHYKSSLNIKSEILTIYLKKYYECIQPGITTDNEETKQKIKQLLLKDFNEKTSKAVTFDKNEMVLDFGCEIENGDFTFPYDDVLSNEGIPF